MSNKADELIKKMMEKRDKAMKKVGAYVEGQAKNNAPVDSGTLKRSITNKVETDKNKSVAEIGTNVEYAYWVEKGTSKMKAQPFLLPSVQQNLDVIKKIIEDELKL